CNRGDCRGNAQATGHREREITDRLAFGERAGFGIGDRNLNFPTERGKRHGGSERTVAVRALDRIERHGSGSGFCWGRPAPEERGDQDCPRSQSSGWLTAHACSPPLCTALMALNAHAPTVASGSSIPGRITPRTSRLRESEGSIRLLSSIPACHCDDSPGAA